MSDELKRGHFSIVGDKPMQLTVDAPDGMPSLTPDQEHKISLVGKAVREYRDTAKRLLSGQYSHLKNFAPKHLADPGNILVGCCSGGVVIRYERKAECPKIFSGWMFEDLPEIATKLSQNLVRCHPSRQFTSTVGETGTEIKLSVFNPDGSKVRDILSFRVGFDVVIEHPDHVPAPPHKPFCLASVGNELEIGLGGVLVADGEKPSGGQRFLARSRFPLGVGWECIEIYPDTGLAVWNPEYASNWAESDILAAVASKQFEELHFQTLDPKAGARKHYAELLNQFRTLLDSEPDREESLQSFLRDHPILLCPAQTKMWPKLQLGGKFTDFVFRDATSDYLLVELEKSTHALFRDDGHAKAELNVAIGQITDWKQYLEDNLRTVQYELGLTGISANPRSLAVIGRSQTLTAENRRKLRAMEVAQPKLRVMTYDDVYDNTKAVIENLFGPIWESVGETQIYYL